MKKHILLLLSICLVLCSIVFYPVTQSFAKEQEIHIRSDVNRESLLEETLLSLLTPYFDEVTNGKAHFCERVLSISRIDRSNNQHDILARVITFEGAHSLPYTLYEIHLTVKPSEEESGNMEVKIIDVKETKITDEKALKKVKKCI